MLKGIPKILPPALLKALCEMGHGDTLVLADGNFPATTVGKNAVIVRMDGHGIPEILDAVLQLFPLDTYVEKPVGRMRVVPGDPVGTPIWDVYDRLLTKHDARGADSVEEIERFAFYERAKGAYLIIATGEQALYANLLLQKGVVTD